MRAFFILCALLFGFLHSATIASADTINVSAAASLKDVLTDLAAQHKTAQGGGGGDEVSFTFGASGQLATMIQDGAPVDLFISAAGKQVDDLVQAGIADPATRRIIAGNTLVLIVPAGDKNAPASFADLADARFPKIAIGNPPSVPAGDYALQTLTALHLADKLADRLIFGTNVRQVLAYVEDADVSAGIVYATDAKESGDKVKVIATADEKLHAPIIYPAVLLKSAKNKATAASFLDFLVSAQAAKAFAAKGFLVPRAAASAPATATAPGAPAP